ncbi:MAG: VCBS repeat-containing protein, partial [Actinobacteria bacterium]
DLGGGFPPGQQSVLTASIPSIEDQHIADFDGDGVGDVVVVGESPGAPSATLAIHRGHGDGSFDSPPVTFPVPGGSPDGFNTIGPNHLAVGDLNADGRPDVVNIAQGDGSVTVLLNGSTPPPPVTPPTSGPTAQDTVVPVITGLTLSSRAGRPCAIRCRRPRRSPSPSLARPPAGARAPSASPRPPSCAAPSAARATGTRDGSPARADPARCRSRLAAGSGSVRSRSAATA